MNTKTQQAAAVYTAQLDNLRRQIELTEQALTSLECTEHGVSSILHPLFFELRRYATALIRLQHDQVPADAERGQA